MSEQISYVTKGGLRPDQNGLPYSLTTEKVESYLQAKLNVVSKAINSPPVTLRLYTAELGRNFLPFFVVLPDTVLENRMKANDPSTNEADDDVGEDIFNPDSDDKHVTMAAPYFKVFKPYIYSKDDEKAFFSEDWRRRTQVSRRRAVDLKNFRTQKLMNINGSDVVVFMIDPVRIFYDMVSNKDRKEDYRIEIVGLKKLRQDVWKYSIRKYSGKNKKPKGDDIFNVLKKRLKF